jgi:hypothetical protein
VRQTADDIGADLETVAYNIVQAVDIVIIVAGVSHSRWIIAPAGIYMPL